MEQPRNHSRRFAVKAEPAADETPPKAIPMPATEQIRAANERAARSEFLVPPPRPIHGFNCLVLNRASPYAAEDAGRTQMSQLERELMGWFKATAEHPQATFADLWRAWAAWQPVNTMTKASLRWNRVEDLLQMLRRRDGETYRQAEAEKLPGRFRRQIQGRLTQATKAFEDAKEAWEKAQADFTRCQEDYRRELERLDAMEAELMERAAA